MHRPQRNDQIPVLDALRVLAEATNGDQIVVTNQGSSRLWPTLRRRELDFHFNPSTMGGAIPLGLGLALAQPQREVIVVSGEGSLLMSLGSLVSVVAARATNLTIVLLDNGQYEVTGGQQTPATSVAVDYIAIARGAGFLSTARFNTLANWQSGVVSLQAAAGPRFAHLLVGPAPRELLKSGSPPLTEQITALQRALGVTGITLG
jgi:thiamine pyrophosphate-dependent acetolactate synthase large subunit-like protein